MEKKKYRSKSVAERISLVLIYAILIIISLVWLIPFVLLVVFSFRGESVGISADYIFPKQWSFKNYITLFTETQFLTWYGNTLLVSVVVTVVQTVIVLMTSYALSRLRFKLRKPLMNIMLILGMFPGFLSMTAVYFVLKEINLTQNLFGLMLVYSASSAMQYYICKGFFDTIPKSLDEAARIDGASRHTVFVKIILPLAKPIIIYRAHGVYSSVGRVYVFFVHNARRHGQIHCCRGYEILVGQCNAYEPGLLCSVLRRRGCGVYTYYGALYMAAKILCGRSYRRLG